MREDIRVGSFAPQRTERIDTRLPGEAKELNYLEAVSFTHPRDVSGRCSGTIHLACLQPQPDLHEPHEGEAELTFRKAEPVRQTFGVRECALRGGEFASHQLGQDELDV